MKPTGLIANVVTSTAVAGIVSGVWNFYSAQSLEKLKNDLAVDLQHQAARLQKVVQEDSRTMSVLSSLEQDLSELDGELRSLSVIAATPNEPVRPQIRRIGLAVGRVSSAIQSPSLRATPLGQNVAALLGTLNPELSKASSGARDQAKAVAALYNEHLASQCERLMSDIAAEKERLLNR